MSFVVAAVIGGGALIGSAVVSDVSQQSAISAEEAGINSQSGLNIQALNTLASNQDIAKYQQDFEEQAQVDPEYAALRTQGAAGVLNALSTATNPNSPQNAALAKAATAATANVAPTQASIASLITQAQQELALGATLPPSFQAELVRSGLSTGGAAGTGVEGEGATGVGVRTLLGSAGLQLQTQRVGQAESELGSAQSLETAQQSALEELAQVSAQMNAGKAALGSGAASMGVSTVPSIGLSGTSDVNMSIANTSLANNKQVQLGQLQGQSSLATGSMISGILGSVGGIASGVGGGTTGVGSGSTASSLGNMIGGLFTSPSQLTASDLTPVTR